MYWDYELYYSGVMLFELDPFASLRKFCNAFKRESMSLHDAIDILAGGRPTDVNDTSSMISFATLSFAARKAV